MAEPRRNRVTVVMEDSLKEIVNELAEVNQRTVSDFIRIILWEYHDALEAAEAEEEAKAAAESE